MLLSLLAFIIVITVVVLPHELGHFLAALWAGIRPLEFGLGFPPRMFSVKRGKTIFSINMVPVGGFIRVAGMNPEAEAEDDPYPPEESYTSKGPLLKILTIISGPIMNFIFAILLLTVTFSIMGIPTGASNEIGSVFPGSEAARIGLRPGDRILAIDDAHIKRMEEAIGLIHKSSGRKLSLTIDRGGEVFDVEATPEYNEELKVGLIGFSPKPVYKRPGVISAFLIGCKETVGIIVLTFKFLGLLITGQTSIAYIAGPVGIAQFSGQAAQGGLMSLIGFAAFLSINLGVVNLLPIPALDGGRIVFIVIEAIRRKPLPQHIENRIHQVGIVLLLSLLLLLTANDVIRWLSAR
jgi:regulator of sigma E protease